jgi:small subunit ribosomal protein S18
MSLPTDKPETPAATAAPGAAAPSAPSALPAIPPAPSAPQGRPQGAGGYRPGGPARPGYQGGQGRPPSGGPGGFRGRGMRRPPMRRKVCRFCVEKTREVDYKAMHVLRSFMTIRGKILSGRSTGTCAKHQRQVTMAV